MAEMESECECSLSRALEDVSQQGYTQSVALQEKQLTLSCLQAMLADVTQEGEEAGVELRSVSRQVLLVEGEIELLQRHMDTLTSSSLSVHNLNTQLGLQIQEHEGRFHLDLAGYNTYRNSMEGHKAAVLRAERMTKAHRELEETRAKVQALMQQQEELSSDLRNPEGMAVRQEQREIDEVKDQISGLRKTMSQQRELLLREFESHSRIKKHIEIQTRRYEAIVKRLHCQLKKAQASHGQVAVDIQHLQGQVDALRTQLETSEVDPLLTDPPESVLKRF
ncbi:coiled-coil domain-containing protein 122 [Osmerus mordax]|uniref:coiled-coil domain-containing protein 122 n=1 Tax=Osmerus mordax TaxID=8014 RepID=UPI00350FD810